MSYCTQPQLIDRYGQQMLVDLTDRAPVATGQIDSAVVAAAIAGADAMIDGYLRAYALPLDTVPPLLGDVALAITIWKLHLGVPGEKITLDYKDARKTLEDISRGTIQLSIEGAAAPSSGGSGAQMVDRERPFTAETMTGFI